MFSIFTGCSQGSAPVPEPVAVEQGKAAVVYFSWSADGNTRFAAEAISAKLGAKIFEIKAERPYRSDYSACCDEAKPECTGKQLRPILPIDASMPRSTT